VIDRLKYFHSRIIDVKALTPQSLDEEMAAITAAVFPRFTIAFTLLISFAVISLTMLDWVHTKPIIGSLGVVSPALAILASLGFLSAIGVEFCNVVGSMPFLILGIGVDDMFIIVEAFRHTKPEDTVEKRMSETFAEAAVSITITSFTDFLGFAIGAITVFPSVYLFCLYTALAVIFDYILQITFFAACMAYDARREDANRHGLTLQVVLPKALSDDKGYAYRLLCSGGVKHEGKIVAKQEEHLASKIIHQYYGPLLVRKPVKMAVIVLFLAYLAVSLYGCTQVKEGLEFYKLARDDSDTHLFFRRDGEFFSEYGPRVMFMKTKTADYSDKAVQTELDNAILEATGSRYVGTAFSHKVTWWLHDYRSYLNRTRGSADVDDSTFMSVLRGEFLQAPRYRRYNLDVRFDQEGKTITASRFLVQTNNLTDANLQRDMMTRFRDIANDHGLAAYHPTFIIYDQYAAVLPNTLQNIGLALVAMLIVATVIIPHPVCAPLIILAIVSIDVGVVGLMQFWEVHLDSISMINLILCIGFSVDFCAHIVYAFIVSEFKTRDDRTVDALHQLGYPIIQGAISTILGTVPLAFSDTYIFRAFFKTLFLVISLGFLHGMVILPVFMSVIGPRGKDRRQQKLDIKVMDRR
jgi:predicted RND superfamily exporter protein